MTLKIIGDFFFAKDKNDFLIIKNKMLFRHKLETNISIGHNYSNEI